MNRAPATLEFYKYTVDFFLAWIELHFFVSPDHIGNCLVQPDG
jgi:hypothetical protein